MNLDERVEAGARVITAEYERYAEKPERLAGLLADTRAVLRAAFPELFADPPTHWLAPWEADDIMANAPWHALSDYDLPLPRGSEGFRQHYVAMRSAHLNRRDGE